MSFRAEMKDFLDAAHSMAGTLATNEDIAASRQKRGLIDEPMGPGNYTPGAGGGVGTTTAPAADGGKTGGGYQTPDLKAGNMPNRGGDPFLNYAYNYYRGKGLSPNHAAAIAGNLQMESGGDPRVLAGVRSGDNGRSMYAAQWDPKRTANLLAFAKQRGNDKPTMQDQFDFVLEEGNPNSPYADAGAVKAHQLAAAAKDPAAATEAFMLNFERPTSDPNINGIAKRQAWATSLIGTDTGAAAPASTGAIPDEAAQPEKPRYVADTSADGQDQQDISTDTTPIDVPAVAAQENQPVPQVSNEEFLQQNPTGLYQEGGAIPDDTDGGFLQFADGGSVDPFNPARDYTQSGISAPTITMTPSINTNPAAATPSTVAKPVPAVKPAMMKGQYRTAGPGGTSPLAVVPGRSGYSLVQDPNNRFLQQNPNARGTGGGQNRFQQLFMQAQRGGVNSLSPNDRQALMRAGLLRGYQAPGQNLQGLTPAPAVPRFAKGGKVANRDQRFQELLREESRGSGAGTMGGSARDRAARRLSAEEGRPSSTAYSPSPPSRQFPAAPKTAGKPPAKTGAPAPLHVRHPPNPTVGKPKTGGTQPDVARMPDVTNMGDPAGANWDTQSEMSPDEITTQLRNNRRKVPGPGGSVITAPDVDVDWGAPGKPAIKLFARGGAIPDDEEPSTFKRFVRGGQKPNVREFKRKAGTLDDTPRTKTSQAKKPKDTGKQQKRDQKKSRPRAGGLPKTAPRPGERPGAGGLPSTGPIPEARPFLPPAGPIPGQRPGATGGEPPRPLQGPLASARLGPQQGPPASAALGPQQGPPVPTPRRPGGPPPMSPPWQAPGMQMPAMPPSRPPVQPGTPPQATGGVMSPIPGVAAPVAPGMDVPRGGTWSPPGAGPPGRMQPNIGSQPAPPQDTGVSGAPIVGTGGASGAGSPVIDVSDTIETLMQKLQALKARDLAWPGTARDATGAQQYARGGAIPDDGGPDPNSAAGEAGYDASSANAPVAGQRGYNERVAQGGTASFDEVAQRAAPSVRAGINGLSRIFGFDATGQQQAAVPTEADAARQDQGIQRFASGEGASTPEEVGAIDKVHGNDRLNVDEGTKNLMRIDQVVQYWLMHGDKDKAEAAAASLLQYGAMQVRQAGTMAAAAFDDYQRTGDPNALRHASMAVERAQQMIPDGVNLKIDIDPKTRQIVATTVGADGKSQKQVVDPQAIPGLLKTAMDGSAYWGAAFQIGQPRLAEQQMVNEGATQREAATRGANQQYEEYKFQRGEEAKIGAEERQQERWRQQQEYQTEHGRSPGERSSREMQQFYESWNQDYQAADTPEEKKSLIEEGLGYRYDHTRDRQDAVPEDLLGFAPESQFGKTFTPEDAPNVRNIARVIAQKEPTMDGGAAMETTGALITAPQLDFNPDGTINVGGNSIVFNPQLLPQLDTLRKKYRQQ